MILIRFKPFSPVLPFLCEKKLKLKQVVYHRKVFSSGKKSFLQEKI